MFWLFQFIVLLSLADALRCWMQLSLCYKSSALAASGVQADKVVSELVRVSRRHLFLSISLKPHTKATAPTCPDLRHPHVARSEWTAPRPRVSGWACFGGSLESTAGFGSWRTCLLCACSTANGRQRL